MLAVTAARFAPDDPLSGLEVGDRPDPEPPEGWATVQVRAASLNHHDLWTLRGVGITEDRLPIVLGCDAAGVTDDGREVVLHALIPGPDADLAEDELLAPGTTILSERHDGTHAELVAVPRRNLIDKPAELSFAEAACLPTAWLTAYRMLFTVGQARPGQSVLIQGAGGGVASAALLLAHAAGLRVFVTSRDPGKRDHAQALGAAGAFEPEARLPQRVDLVLESVGEATWRNSIRSVRSGGTIVVCGTTTGPNPPADLQHVFFRHLRILGSTMGTRSELERLLAMLVDTGVRPPVDATYPLAEARDAYAQLNAGDVFGKIVVTN